MKPSAKRRRRARSRPLDAARVREQLQKTGGTVYVLDSIDLDADETAFAAPRSSTPCAARRWMG